MPLKIVFMGTPEFAVPALEGIIASSHRVVAAYCQPPRPAGRGQKLRPSPVQLCAEAAGIAVESPVNFKSAESIAALRAWGADIAVVAAYGLLLPPAVLEAFPMGCINIHPSALPRWRGAAPLHRTVLAGDTETEICIMQMDAGLDTGPVLSRRRYSLPDDITTGALHDQLSQEAVPLLLETLSALENGTAIAIPQTEEGVTYAQKITKEEAQIDWSLPAEVIARHVRGLFPFPSAVTTLYGEPVKILSATWKNSPTHSPAGTVLDEHFRIACGQGVLHPQYVQRAGKKALPVEEMLRGYPIPAGTRLGA